MIISIHTPFDYRVDRHITIAYSAGDVDVDEETALYAIGKGFATSVEQLEDFEDGEED